VTVFGKLYEALLVRHQVGHQRCKADTEVQNTNMGILYNGDTELLEESDRFFDIRVGCDLVGLFTNYEYAPVDSKHLPEPKDVPNYPKKEGLILTIDHQKRRA